MTDTYYEVETFYKNREEKIMRRVVTVRADSDNDAEFKAIVKVTEEAPEPVIVTRTYSKGVVETFVS